MDTSVVFSEYELREMGFKFDGSVTYQSANCVGSCSEELETKVVVKKCRGTVAKKRVSGTGNGTLSIKMHCPVEIYNAAYGMELDSLIDGVKAYGRNSVHKSFSVVQHVYDEDGKEKFKAYPNCIMESGVKRTIENGAEEIAEIEMDISIQPDEYGNGMYEALASEITENTVKTKWMTGFTPDMVQVVSA